MRWLQGHANYNRRENVHDAACCDVVPNQATWRVWFPANQPGFIHNLPI